MLLIVLAIGKVGAVALDKVDINLQIADTGQRC
jgi:hypothetical protein